MPDADTVRDDEMDTEEMEVYCVSCRQRVSMEAPTPVWTRRGTPGTRGICAECGGTVFRMGRTAAHGDLARPDVSAVREVTRKTRYAAYITYAGADEALAQRLSEDLPRMGVPVWLEEEDPSLEDVRWASGVHPALDECSHMIVVLSEAALQAEQVAESWRTFRQQRKPIVVAMGEQCDVPDDLRRAPRFDFTGDYKTAFRQMVQALAE